MKKISAVIYLFLAVSPWNTAALRKQRRHHKKRNKDAGSDGDEGMDENEIVEVIIGLNVAEEEEEPTFTTMSNTIDLLEDNSVSLEELIPQIRSGVVRVPLRVRDYFLAMFRRFSQSRATLSSPMLQDA